MEKNEISFLREDERAWGIALFESVISSGQGAQKALFLINGGASVAVLALWGHLVTLPKGNPAWEIAPMLLESLCFFGIGIVSAALVAGLTYVNQKVFTVEMVKNYSVQYHNMLYSQEIKENPKQLFGLIIQSITILTWVFSLGVFIWGMLVCREGFLLFLKGMTS